MAKSDIFIATASFVTDYDGRSVVVQAGKTRVRAGHPLLEGREDQFKLVDVHFDVETVRQAPAAPKSQAKTATKGTPKSDAD